VCFCPRAFQALQLLLGDKIRCSREGRGHGNSGFGILANVGNVSRLKRYLKTVVLEGGIWKQVIGSGITDHYPRQKIQ